MDKKLSTTEKLSRILNGRPEGDDDETVKAAKAHKQNRAKDQLRRASLYGGGARAIVPKVKKADQTSGASPLAFADTKLLETHLLQRETTSIPPGAHDEQFRRVQSQTRKSLNDPDRVFFQPTLLNPSLRIADQPPWYLGNQNKINPPDKSILKAAARYGYRGARGIQQYLTETYEPPERTKTPYTPKFLNTDPMINEYTPTLAMMPYFNGYHPNLISPKLWPESACFVNVRSNLL
jgi:hypothetical protein